METDFDIIIAGGGLNGPSLGIALAQAGMRVCVIDPRPADLRAARDFDGRAYALAHASQRLLRAIGVWQKVHQKAQPIHEIKASDGYAGQGAAQLFLHFLSDELSEGSMGFMLEERYLYAALRAQMQECAGLTMLYQDAVVGQECQPSGVAVHLASGKTLHSRVLIGCDGRNSGVAKRAGIAYYGHDYGQTALVCAIRHERHHNGVAQQFFMPAGPFALLPLAGGHHSSVVWSEQRAQAAGLAALSDQDFITALRPRIGDFLGDIRLEGVRFQYPLSLALAQNYAAHRIALVGDAAHGVHPIAGQGLNLGLRDVAALAEVIVLAARRGEDIGGLDVLQRYEAWRRFDATALAFGMDQVNRIFSNDNPLIRLGRGIGMGLVSSMPTLRRGFMRQAAGLGGVRPQLLEGRAP